MVGLVFIVVFLAIRFKWTDVPGEVDNLSPAFQQNIDQSQVLGVNVSKETDDLGQLEKQINQLSDKKNQKIKYLCDLEALSYVAPKNVQQIINIHKTNGSDFIASQMIFAVKTHLDNLLEVDNCISNFDPKKINEEIIS